MEKNNLVFVALSEPENIKRTIYGDILRYAKSHFSTIYIVCIGHEGVFEDEGMIFHSGSVAAWPAFFRMIPLPSISYFLLTDFFIGGTIAARYAKKNNTPMVYRCGGPWHYEPTSIERIAKILTLKFTKPYVIRRCKKVVYNSKSIIQPIKHKFEVVYNGVDTNLFRPQKTKPISKKRSLLFIGRILPEKGLDYLFKAVQGLDVHLSIVGDGDLRTKYEKDNPKVKFYGRLPKNQLPKIINQHDVVVLPSLVESFPNVLLEAMACAKPVIGTRIFGIPEMIDHNINGYIVPPKNSKELRKAILFLAQNKQRLKQLGANGRKKVLEHFKKEKQFHKLFQALFG